MDVTGSAGQRSGASGCVTLFLSGDVMTGRGIDQILPHPGSPRIHEVYVKSARRYVELAEALRGEIPKPVTFSYVWGEMLEEFERVAPDVRIVNLETALTRSEDYWRGKGIHYRMHPDNIPCLTAAGIDCCALANNHVLDWGYFGLDETLATLNSARIRSAGAGSNAQEAEAPALLEVDGHGRVAVFSFGSVTSGIPLGWDATRDRPGVNLLTDLSHRTVRHIAARVRKVKRTGDIVVASIHWGANWGYAIPQEQRRFAHRLVDEAGVDVVHGHSSHHVKGIEIYEGRPIIYGCGDFLTDYEGIEGHQQFRDDLGLMYFLTMDRSTGKAVRINLTPTQIRKFRVSRVSASDRRWLRDILTREGRRFGTWAEAASDHTLVLRWGGSQGSGWALGCEPAIRARIHRT
jgi:poly-gamma-glutamate synthesis protein (capsule biosynthesis protein)